VNNIRYAATPALLGPEARPTLSAMNGRWPQMPGEHFPVLWIGQTAVVTLPAEIDITIADQVREDLLSVVNQGAALLVADLTNTTFCDWSGVSALVRASRRAQASGGKMRLVVRAPAVHRVLALTGVDRLVDVYASVAASISAPNRKSVLDDTALGEKADTDGGAA